MTSTSTRPRLFAPRLHRYRLAPAIFIGTNVILFALFFVWPATIGIGYSFTDYSGVGDANFIGLDNYVRLFADSDFWHALTRSLLYAALAVPLTYVASLGTALLIVSPYAHLRSVARVMFFVPWLISPIVTGVIWRWIFGQDFGLVNFIIESLGGQAVQWQSSADLSLVIVAVASAWASTAFNMLLFVSAIKNVPVSYYEAAELDGAGSWGRFRHITLPSIAPTSLIVILLTTLGSMQQFATVQAVNGGGPGTENNLLVQYIYTTGFERAQVGYASAASFILMLILLTLALIQLGISRAKKD